MVRILIRSSISSCGETDDSSQFYFTGAEAGLWTIGKKHGTHMLIIVASGSANLFNGFFNSLARSDVSVCLDVQLNRFVFFVLYLSKCFSY